MGKNEVFEECVVLVELHEWVCCDSFLFVSQGSCVRGLRDKTRRTRLTGYVNEDLIDDGKERGGLFRIPTLLLRESVVSR